MCVGGSNSGVKVQQPSRGRAKATGTVERFQRLLVINVEPFRTAFLGKGCRLPNQCRSDTSPLVVVMNGGIEQKGMRASVPRDIDEADEAIVVVRADPSQTALEDRTPLPRLRTLPRRRPEVVERVAADGEILHE